MKKLIKMPSIVQFNQIVSNIIRNYNYVGLDEFGNPIYDQTIKKPVINFTGSIKLHGTNASVCYNNEKGFWVQSKGNIITPESDNAGFAFFAETKKEILIEIIKNISIKENVSLDDNTITIYGEWCGTGVQKNVGISQIPKSLFIFGIKISSNTDVDDELVPLSRWVESNGYSSNEDRIFNLGDYKTYDIEVDFSRPDIAQNKMVELTLEVERECPVSKTFGIDEGIGEGIVWKTMYKGGEIRFKTKGELHAGKSKTKTISSIDSSKINELIELSNKVTPTWRLDQMITETFDLINGGTFEMKDIGRYIKAVIGDIVKEEGELLLNYNATPKDISKYVSVICKDFFILKLNELNGI